MTTITLPAETALPVGARFEDAVDLAVVAVAQCPAGHLLVDLIPDEAATEAVTRRHAAWAAEHADSCTKPAAGAAA